MGISSSGASGGLFNRDDFPALVGAAVRTDMVGKLGRVALWTSGCRSRLEEIVRPSHVFSGFGMSLDWICHMVLPFFFKVFP
jgi:hypothetical protein